MGASGGGASALDPPSELQLPLHGPAKLAAAFPVHTPGCRAMRLLVPVLPASSAEASPGRPPIAYAPMVYDDLVDGLSSFSSRLRIFFPGRVPPCTICLGRPWTAAPHIPVTVPTARSYPRRAPPKEPRLTDPSQLSTPRRLHLAGLSPGALARVQCPRSTHALHYALRSRGSALVREVFNSTTHPGSHSAGFSVSRSRSGSSRSTRRAGSAQPTARDAYCDARLGGSEQMGVSAQKSKTTLLDASGHAGYFGEEAIATGLRLSLEMRRPSPIRPGGGVPSQGVVPLHSAARPHQARRRFDDA